MANISRRADARQPVSASFDDDLTEIRAVLRSRIADIAEFFRGPANRALSKRHELRFGRQGSLSVITSGAKQGLWHDREADKGGDAFALIMQEHRCDFPGALEWARDYTGIHSNTDGLRVPFDRETARAAREAEQVVRKAEDAADQQKRIRTAQGIWSSAQPIDGTRAETYLVHTRAIPRPAAGWPDAVRFHNLTGSLVVAATTDAGEVRAVQRVRLTVAAEKVTDDKPTKVSNGVFDGAYVRLPATGADDTLILAEGPETGLSAWVSTGNETWVYLGSVANAEVPIGRRVIVARDDDAPGSTADRALSNAVVRLKIDGAQVSIATPWKERRYDKSDLNDTIKAGGTSAVRERIDAAVSDTPNRVSATEARQQLDLVIRDFRVAAARWNKPGDETVIVNLASLKPIILKSAGKGTPPVHAIRVDTGSGKSSAARRYAAVALAALRRSGSKKTIVFAVPTHDLGEDQAELFMALPIARKHGLTAAVWHGREAVDPGHPDAADDRVGLDQKTRMCRNIEAVKLAQFCITPVQSAVCERKKGGAIERCPLFYACGYQRQRASEADLWFVPHDLLFTKKPDALGDIAAVIVDEAAWQDGLPQDPQHVPLSALSGDADISDNAEATERLSELRKRGLAVIEKMSADGPIRREDFAVEFTEETAHEANALEYERLIDPCMTPKHTFVERKELAKVSKHNQAVKALATFWLCVADMLADPTITLSGWVASGKADFGGHEMPALTLKPRRAVRVGWRVPTLILDATMNVELNRPFWPQVEQVADLRLSAPHMRVRQVTDQTYAKSRFISKMGTAPEEANRRRNRLQDLRAILWREARRYAPGRVLVVVQKDVKKRLIEMGAVPSNVMLAHHNAVAGRDEWRDVAALIVVGRTLPGPTAVERIVESLTGRHVPPLGASKWYDRRNAAREMADGTHQAATADAHPHPIAEAIRWQTAEGELVQIIGRVRGVNRTEADPVEVLIMTNLPLPLPLSEVVLETQLEPSHWDLMMAEGGFAFENAGHAARAYPVAEDGSGLFLNAEAARKLFQRERTRTLPSKELLIGLCPTPRVNYRLAGTGQKMASAWVDTGLVGDVREALTSMLGELAYFAAEAQVAPAATDGECKQSGREAELLDPSIFFRVAKPENYIFVGDELYTIHTPRKVPAPVVDEPLKQTKRHLMQIHARLRHYPAKTVRPRVSVAASVQNSEADEIAAKMLVYVLWSMTPAGIPQVLAHMCPEQNGSIHGLS